MKTIITLILILNSIFSYSINTDSLYNDTAYLARFNKELNLEFTRLLDSTLLSNFNKYVESKNNELRYKFLQKKRFKNNLEVNYPNGYEPCKFSYIGHNIAKALSEMYIKDFLDNGPYRLFTDSVEYSPSHYKVFSNLKEYSSYFNTENTIYAFNEFVISIGKVIPDIFKDAEDQRIVFNYESDNTKVFARKIFNRLLKVLPNSIDESIFTNVYVSFDDKHHYVFILVHGSYLAYYSSLYYLKTH
jgi:regulator of replication initiation timing